MDKNQDKVNGASMVEVTAVVYFILADFWEVTSRSIHVDRSQPCTAATKYEGVECTPFNRFLAAYSCTMDVVVATR